MGKHLFRGNSAMQINELGKKIFGSKGGTMKRIVKFLAVCACLGLLVALPALPVMAALTPSISLSPGSGVGGTSVTVTGSGYGKNKSVQGVFNGTNVFTATTSSSHAFTATFTVPAATSAGSHPVTATQTNKPSKTATAGFNVLSPVFNISPTSGTAGVTVVTCNGSTFESGEHVSITFDGTEVATPTATTLGVFSTSFTVPASAGAGSKAVVAHGLSSGMSVSQNFTVSSTSLSLTIDPTIGPPTSMVTVKGAGFPPNDAVQVFFDNDLWFMAAAGADGKFSQLAQVPNWFYSPGSVSIGPNKAGKHLITATGGISVQATFTVHTSWPQWRMNARHSGTNLYDNNLNQANATLLQEVWQFDPADGVIVSSPVYVNIKGQFMVLIVSAGKYAGLGSNYNATLWALDATSGVPIWHYDIGRGPADPNILNVIPPDFIGIGTPAVDVAADRVYIGGSDDWGVEGVAYCIEASTGTLKWFKDLPSPVLASPTLGGNGLVYFPTIACVNPGNPNFFALNQNTGAISGSCVVGAQTGKTTNLFSSAAFDALNNFLWIGAVDFADNTQNGLWRLNANGTNANFTIVVPPAIPVPIPQNQQPWGDAAAVFSSPAVSNGRVFYTTVGGPVYLVGVSANAPYNQYFAHWIPFSAPAVSSPAVAPSNLAMLPGVPGVIYVGSGTHLGAYDIFGGFMLNVSFPSAIYSSPAAVTGWLSGLAVPGLVFVGDGGGRLWARAADDISDAVWMASTGSSTYGIMSSPTVADGWVYVGGSDGAVHAYTIPTP